MYYLQYEDMYHTVWYDIDYNLINWLTPYSNTCIMFELNYELIYIIHLKPNSTALNMMSELRYFHSDAYNKCMVI